MAQDNVVIRFDSVSFSYDEKRVILDDTSFSVRRNSIVTIIGQNGAGKSTLFSLITNKKDPEDGKINIAQRTTIALSRQVIPREELSLTVREFFQKCFKEPASAGGLGHRRAEQKITRAVDQAPSPAIT